MCPQLQTGSIISTYGNKKLSPNNSVASSLSCSSVSTKSRSKVSICSATSESPQSKPTANDTVLKIHSPTVSQQTTFAPPPGETDTVTTSDTNKNMLPEISTRHKMKSSTESQQETPARKRSTSQSDNHMKNVSEPINATDEAGDVQDSTNNESGKVPALVCTSGGMNARETNRGKREDFNGKNMGHDVSHSFG